MKNLTHHLRFGVRLFLKRPGFSLTTILTLAVGIGANTAMFSIVSALVFPPLPTPDPARLAVVRSVSQPTGAVLPGTSRDDLEIWRARSRTVERFAAFSWAGPMALTDGGRTEPVRGTRTSANLFETLNVAPLLGRTFTAAEEKPAAANVAVLSYDLWQRRFGGEPSVIGRSVKIEGRFHDVIGVMPERFDVMGAELFLPPNAEDRPLQVFARMKPGSDVDAVQNELAAIAKSRAETSPSTNRDLGVNVVSLRQWYGGEFAGFGTLLFGAAALVLLVACANVAGLLIATGIERRKEIAVRLAMGATRAGIIGQLMAENTLLAFLGGTVGVVAANWLIAGLNASIPPEYHWHFTLNAAALAFAVGLSAVTTWLCGFFPAWHTSSPDLNHSLKEGLSKSPGTHRLRNALTIGTISISLFLLVGQGLLIRSLVNWNSLDPGFDPTGTVTLWLNFSGPRFRRTDDAQRRTFETLERMKRLPGVTSVAAANHLPLDQADAGSGLPFTVDGTGPTALPADPSVLGTAVSEDYFTASGMRLLKGRSFAASDQAVAVVNDRLARACFPNGDALGRQLKLGGKDDPVPWLTIVGVVADVRHPGRLELSEIPLDIYIPLARQTPLLGWNTDESRMNSVNLIARTTGDPRLVTSLLPKLVWDIDPEQPLQPARHIRTLEDSLWRESFEKRGFALLVGLFSVSALSLSAIGLYGLLAGYFLERKHEFGIRAALGAQPTDVMYLVFRQGLKLTLPGIGIGLALALALTRILRSMLFEISPTDPLTFGFAPLFLLGVAWLACLVPARRAARVDPATALRCE
jgi:putative ABC transport system permease protein